ncbi:hypothetical protein [Burkholderia gladioli]|uniref:hypothetical protein n=1 Tax=Burkholderia gladioli TaxID=28095 RepID=UPI00163E4105|nr:hypothetical protein [Burkholderia gladioli]MBU9170863.1 hypothetical protein [Burkholderia gladioli]MBU9218892.1 hypothetical protein [Burkholderia gladioli]MBU9385440.1 hypothetical protein [Burkholderia gladioli]MDN7728265.1 hypothetical protein [Burkholderia gladioli]MDN7807274.1 hypothetical protein [Burkholderia gladioli]
MLDMLEPGKLGDAWCAHLKRIGLNHYAARNGTLFEMSVTWRVGFGGEMVEYRGAIACKATDMSACE